MTAAGSSLIFLWQGIKAKILQWWWFRGQRKAGMSAQPGTWFRCLTAVRVGRSCLHNYRLRFVGTSQGWKAVRGQSQTSSNMHWPWSCETKESQEQSVCNTRTWGFSCWAAAFGPTKHHLPSQVLSTAHARHGCLSWVFGLWLPAAQRASSLLLSATARPVKLAFRWDACSSSKHCLVCVRLACLVRLWTKAASLLTSTLLCLPFPCTPYSWTPAVGCAWSSAHPPHHQIRFSKLCSCFCGRWTLLSSYFWLLKKRGFGVSKFQMNSVHPSAIQACQKTFKNLRECKPNLWWLRVRPLHPLE